MQVYLSETLARVGSAAAAHLAARSVYRMEARRSSLRIHVEGFDPNANRIW
jgi:hypothetical protein